MYRRCEHLAWHGWDGVNNLHILRPRCCTCNNNYRLLEKQSRLITIVYPIYTPSAHIKACRNMPCKAQRYPSSVIVASTLPCNAMISANLSPTAKEPRRSLWYLPPRAALPYTPFAVSRDSSLVYTYTYRSYYYLTILPYDRNGYRGVQPLRWFQISCSVGIIRSSVPLLYLIEMTHDASSCSFELL